MLDAEYLDNATEGLINLLASFSPVERRKLLRQMARYLIAGNQKRIKGNIQPDGSDMEPRKEKKERMFRKLGRFIKHENTPNMVEVGYSGIASKIATNHQFGRYIQTQQGGFDLPVRELLGFADNDPQAIRDMFQMANWYKNNRMV